MPHDPVLPARSERGASLTEYALLVALITIATLSAFTAFSSSNEDMIGGSASKISNAMSGP